jgi:cell division protein FtsB
MEDTMTGKGLSKAEREWAEANAEAVRALMKGSKPDSEPELPADAADRAAHHLIKSMTKKIAKLQPRLVEARERIARYEQIVANPATEDDTRKMFQDILDDEGDDRRQEIAKIERHIEALETKIKNLKDDPRACFLPLGTIVRFTGAAPSYEISDTYGDTAKSYPVADSVGMVTSLSMDGEFPIKVSMRHPFKDGWETQVYPDDDRIPTYRVDLEIIEVVGYAQLPDGSEYHGFEYRDTYVRNDKYGKKERDSEMILYALDHYWRLHDFGGTQGIEVLQAYDTMEEMPWLDGPLPEFAPEGADRKPA